MEKVIFYSLAYVRSSIGDLVEQSKLYLVTKSHPDGFNGLYS